MNALAPALHVASAAPAMRCPCCGQLTAARPDPVALVAALNLGPVKQRLADHLALNFGRWLHTERLACVLWGDALNGGPLNATNLISVHLHNMRARLATVGLVVLSRNGAGGRKMWWLDGAAAP